MLLKNAGTLSEDYFNAYFKLIQNARNCTVEEAKDMIWERLFAGNRNSLGNSTYQNFMAAYQQWKRNID